MGDINYQQLYAQVLYEIRELKSPYWFNNDEVARIQELNLEYMEKKDIAEIVMGCFRKPKEDENVKGMSCSEMLGYIRKLYPSVPNTHGSKVSIGTVMRNLGFESKDHSNVPFYKVVPLQAA